MTACLLKSLPMMPTWMAMAVAVPRWSPVNIRGMTEAEWQSLMAEADSGRGGSLWRRRAMADQQVEVATDISQEPFHLLDTGEAEEVHVDFEILSRHSLDLLGLLDGKDFTDEGEHPESLASEAVVVLLDHGLLGLVKIFVL